MGSTADYSSDDNFYGDDGDDDEEEGVAELELKPCGNCGRNFNPDVLPRHYNICAKLKNRKAFDSKKQRMAELGKIAITTKPPNNTNPKPKKKDWRAQHEQFIKNIRAVRGPAKPGQSPEPMVNPDYVQCPHCQRRFNESAAERHIDFCKEQQSRIPKASADSKYADKKTKMEKRSTYKPPLPGVKKRGVGGGGAPGGIAKPRTNNNSAPANQNMKPRVSPPSHNHNTNNNGQRSAKSDTTIAGQRRPKHIEADERPLSNERYTKSGGKSRGSSEPKWFEDLKRNDSGNQLRRNKINDDLDAVDSGMDLNENYPRTTQVANKNNNKNNVTNSPVGVVQPSSRTKEEAGGPDGPGGRAGVSSGRRKMANFCHDCGTRYPVTEAKFCCECGVKRMALV